MRVERISLESERLLQVIRSKISDTPICVQIDPYDCEWSDFYQKEHWTHHLVICDIDEEKRIYYCADIYYPSKKHILVPFDALENMCNSIDVIHPEKDACVGAEIVMNYMKRYLNMSVPTVRDEESKLLHLFLNEFNFDSIGNPKQLNTSILLIKLSWIAVDKRLFCEGLKHIEQTILRNRFFENIYEPLALVEKKINVLKNTLIKCSLTKIMQYNSIVQLIKEIVCLNSYILTILQDALKELNA
jgi:hypothetical protein